MSDTRYISHIRLDENSSGPIQQEDMDTFARGLAILFDIPTVLTSVDNSIQDKCQTINS